MLFLCETGANYGEREKDLVERQLLFQQNLDINNTGKETMWEKTEKRLEWTMAEWMLYLKR